MAGKKVPERRSVTKIPVFIPLSARQLAGLHAFLKNAEYFILFLSTAQYFH
jgi:hypothetical protein